MKNKNVTIYQYLKDANPPKNMNVILDNLELDGIEINDFFSQFGKMTSDEMINFILDGKNSFKLGLFGHTKSGTNRISAYNGFSRNIYGYNTLGAKNSNFAGGGREH